MADAVIMAAVRTAAGKAPASGGMGAAGIFERLA
jgi:hypothetical protein